MVLNHVAQRAGLLVVAASTALHAEVFGTGDLDVADVFAVPERFENRVCETQHHQVLRGFLAEVVVDPVSVPLLEGLVDDLIEVLRGLEVGAKRLLDDHAGPAAVLGFVESGGFQVQ